MAAFVIQISLPATCAKDLKPVVPEGVRFRFLSPFSVKVRHVVPSTVGFSCEDDNVVENVIKFRRIEPSERYPIFFLRAFRPKKAFLLGQLA